MQNDGRETARMAVHRLLMGHSLPEAGVRWLQEVIAPSALTDMPPAPPPRPLLEPPTSAPPPPPMLLLSLPFISNLDQHAWHDPLLALGPHISGIISVLLVSVCLFVCFQELTWAVRRTMQRAQEEAERRYQRLKVVDEEAAAAELARASEGIGSRLLRCLSRIPCVQSLIRWTREQEVERQRQADAQKEEFLRLQYEAVLSARSAAEAVRLHLDGDRAEEDAIRGRATAGGGRAQSRAAQRKTAGHGNPSMHGSPEHPASSKMSLIMSSSSRSAKLIAMKAWPAEGTGSDDDAEAGKKWDWNPVKPKVFTERVMKEAKQHALAKLVAEKRGAHSAADASEDEDASPHAQPPAGRPDKNPISAATTAVARAAKGAAAATGTTAASAAPARVPAEAAPTSASAHAARRKVTECDSSKGAAPPAPTAAGAAAARRR